MMNSFKIFLISLLLFVGSACNQGIMKNIRKIDGHATSDKATLIAKAIETYGPKIGSDGTIISLPNFSFHTTTVENASKPGMSLRELIGLGDEPIFTYEAPPGSLASYSEPQPGTSTSLALTSFEELCTRANFDPKIPQFKALSQSPGSHFFCIRLELDRETYAYLASPSLEIYDDTPANPTISIAANEFTYTTGDSVTIDPIVIGGTVTIAPALTNGLSLDAATGAITGTLTGTLPETEYTLTVTNPIGATAVQTIKVAVYSAPSISLPSSSFVYATGAVANITPVVANGLVRITPALSNGLSLDTTTGAISGKTSGTLPETEYTLTVLNPAQAASEKKITIGIYGVPSLSLSQLTYKFTAGTSASITPAIEHGVVTVSPALSNGLSLNMTTGAITGVPSGPLPETAYTLTVANPTGATAVQTVKIAVYSAPSISLSPSNFAYTTGAVANISPTVANGEVSISPALANGLSLDPTTGAITGTTSGTLPETEYTLTVSNPAQATAEKKITIGIYELPTISLTPLTYSFTTGATASIAPTIAHGVVSVAPALSNGLSLNTTTGAITGLLTGALAETDYTLTVTSPAGATAVQTVKIAVYSAPSISLSPSNFAYTTGAVANITPTVADGEVSISPALANGLSLDPTTGAITGTTSGTLPETEYTLTVSNPAQATAEKKITIGIYELPTISLTPLTYSFTTGATASIAPTIAHGVVSVAPALNNGLSLNTTTGAISGTVTGTLPATSYTLTVTNEAGGAASQAITIGIYAAPTISVSPTTYSYMTGDVASIAPSVANGTVSIAPALSNGLSLNTTTGAISGTTSTTLAETEYTLSVTNLANTTVETDIIIGIYADPGAPSISLASPSISSSTAATFTVATCGAQTGIYASESATRPLAGAAGWQTCSNATGAITHTLSSGDGVKTIYFWSKEAHGIVSTASTSLTVTLDTTPPLLSIGAAPSGTVPGGSTQQVSWTGSDTNLVANPIKIEYHDGSAWTTAVAAMANTSPYTWTVPNVTAASYKLRLTASDGAGLTTAVESGVFAIAADNTAPAVTSLAIVEGASTAYNSINLNIVGADTSGSSLLTAICLKYNNTTKPTASDACWIAAGDAPYATSVNLTQFPFTIGFAQGVYAVYAWLKDQAGNISDLGNGGAGTEAIDKATVTYSPGAPPTISEVVSSSGSTFDSPATNADLTVAQSGDVYIHWNAAAAGGSPLSSTPVSLTYTLDDQAFTTIATGLANGSNNGCAVASGMSGCYVWSGGSPSSSYFRIQVAVVSAGGATTMLSGSPMNVSVLKLVAGKTDAGIGSSATTAALKGATGGGLGDQGSLAVASDGTIYFRDVTQGIYRVSPTSGVLTKFLPTTGVNSGNGAVSSATLRLPIRIALDFQDRLLIWDYDRIRRVDASGTNIETIIGGGADSGDVSGGIAALSFDLRGIPAYYTGASDEVMLTPLPNGDIWFRSENHSIATKGYRLRIYHADTQKVTSFYLSGTGYANYPSADLSTLQFRNIGISFNPSTSQLTNIQAGVVGVHSWTYPQDFYPPGTVINGASVDGTSTAVESSTSGLVYAWGMGTFSGRNGSLYRFISFRLIKYDPVSRVFTNVLGTGTTGNCADGTPATSCDVNLQDAFVTSAGGVYFVDSNVIRTIDADGNVITVMGESQASGDGGLAISARFNEATWLQQGKDGKFIILDDKEARFREFTPDGNITTIAGNGKIWSTAYGSGTLATTQPIGGGSFVADPATGDIFARLNSHHIGVLRRSLGYWSRMIGGGATAYPSGDTLSGLDLSFNYYLEVMGFDSVNQKLLARAVAGGDSNVFLKLYTNDASATQSTLAGVPDVVANVQATYEFCADNTPMASCHIPWNWAGIGIMQYDHNAGNSRWLARETSKTRIAVLPIDQNDTKTSLPVTFNHPATAFVYDASANVIYYCSETDQKIHKVVVGTATESTLDWPVASIKCKGMALIFQDADALANPPRPKTLTFIYTQNGLTGVAQYFP